MSQWMPMGKSVVISTWYTADMWQV